MLVGDLPSEAGTPAEKPRLASLRTQLLKRTEHELNEQIAHGAAQFKEALERKDAFLREDS